MVSELIEGQTAIVLVGSCQAQKFRSAALYFGSCLLRMGGKYVALTLRSRPHFIESFRRALQLAV